jgi:3-deoxy-D-manno-octulosonate 8-phosphate phosphatase (KDO 8-P phosphatase)
MSTSSRDPANVRLMLFDVDGVLTDGGIVIDDDGRESKRFHVRDGFAMRQAVQAGVQVGVITGRESRAVTLRMTELKIELLRQGARDKGAAVRELCVRAGVDPVQAAFVGDDLIDLPAMRVCGYAIAVADAAAEVRAAADFVTTVCGGQGAAREAIEHVLRAQGKWDAVVQRYRGG